MFTNEEKVHVFFNIHSKFKGYMVSKIKSSYKLNSYDIVQDYLIYFIDKYLKYFNWDWEKDAKLAEALNISVKEFIIRRAKNWYLQRFFWYLDSNSPQFKHIKKHYIGSNFDYNAYENIAYNASFKDDNICNTSEYRKIIFSTDFKNDLDFRIYVEQLISYIYLNVNNVKTNTKMKIIKYFNDYILFGESNITDYFTNSVIAKNLILKIVTAFNVTKIKNASL